MLDDGNPICVPRRRKPVGHAEDGATTCQRASPQRRPERRVARSVDRRSGLVEQEDAWLPRSARANVGRWPNGCGGSRGLALDEQRGFIFVGCSEGKTSVIDAGSGALLSTLSAGSGVDVISYSPELRHLYVPGSDSATMAVLAVSVAGKLALLGTVGTTRGSHCVVADDRARAWICDQDRGQLLLYTDALPVP